MSPTLSRSSALQRVKLCDALEIRNRIIFDFYPGLPHMVCMGYRVYHPIIPPFYLVPPTTLLLYCRYIPVHYIDLSIECIHSHDVWYAWVIIPSSPLVLFLCFLFSATHCLTVLLQVRGTGSQCFRRYGQQGPSQFRTAVCAQWRYYVTLLTLCQICNIYYCCC